MLFGREAELGLMAAFARGAPEFGPVLLFSGEPGAGKTALLDAGAEQAERAGRRVLRATALEYEADLTYGALNLVLHPLLDQLPALDEAHRHAVAVICGLEPGPPPAQLLAGAAALALLTRVAADRPLMLVVDDAPWLDLASAMALAYVARRLRDAAVRLLVAARSELENVFVRSGFDAHVLPPLSERSADALLADRFPALPANVRRRIRAEALGNPLALLDLPAALDADPRPLTDTLPLTERLTALYARRLRDLPGGTRELLLFVVLAGAENSMTLEQCTRMPTGQDDLAPAERAGIVRLNPRSGRLEFRHPLLRSAVVELSASEERRHAHALLAEAFRLDPQRRAWHLGQSASGPDEDVARLLEAVSGDLLHAGNSTRATAAMLRAAELSPARADRARRVARAAYLGSHVTGQLQAGPRLLVDAQPEPDGAPSLAAVTAAAYQLLNGEGDASSAQRLLVAALDALPGPLDAADDPTVEALHTLVAVGFYAGRAEFWADTHRQFARVLPELPELLALLDVAFGDPARGDVSVVGRLDAALDGLRFSSDPVRITRVATAAAHLDRVGRAREPLWRVIDDGRRGGAVAKEIESLFLIGLDAWVRGRWDELEQVVDDGLRLCDELGYALTAAPGRYLRAMADAARGREAVADEAAEQLLLWAAPRRLYTLAAYASHVRCLLQLPHGRFESAYRHAASVSPAGTLQPFLPHAVWLVFDLVEAATRSGRTAVAAAHVRAAEEAGLGLLSDRLGLLVGAAGALTDPADWRDRFDLVLAASGAERWPFDRARVQLVYGEQLRRAHAPADARAQLAAAVDAFRDLRAAPWAGRAVRELRAAGGIDPGGDELTPQEATVARLAATGLTNKEIAAQLYLSPRTVSTHLSRVFPKLGIGSRGALRDALERRRH
ncbi:LuxR family transcriptional regulator [Jiangella alkaliphila]|uniref:Regulatory protein, luxR family n=1 Tax=Jiangella alkaliphila TaxID=419479 RepID=A0A1H2KXZ0_9ACTN|nr:LuxR family transcriptional regulator [Jiangella alkaliphila]SDU73455.1 regulatory protein, luxR family [Jiangella alkaliphila]